MHRKAGKIEKEGILMRKSSPLTEALKWHLLFVVFLCSLFIHSQAQAFTLNVVDQNGTPITGGFRYLVEEDTTHPNTPGVISGMVRKSSRWASPRVTHRF